MIEYPEAATYAAQFNHNVRGKRILQAQAGRSPHKFAFYTGDPAGYGPLLAGKEVGASWACGGKFITEANPGYAFIFGDGGEKILLHQPGARLPDKHQLLLVFEDSTALTLSVAGWGFVQLVPQAEVARTLGDNANKPPVDSPDFSPAYFLKLAEEALAKPSISVKEFLAAGQRVPGLGNGCLQDILLLSRIHPRRKLMACSQAELLTLYDKTKLVLYEATRQGGRDTETDLFGQPGGYPKVMDARTAGQPCPQCGHTVEKIAYMGGACYVCPNCQREQG